MFFVLVIMPAAVGILRAAAEVKTMLRRRKAWMEEAQQVNQQFGGERSLYRMDVLLTDEEKEKFSQTPEADFLAERRVSVEAASFWRNSE